VVVEDDAELKKIAQAMQDYAPRSTNEAYWLRDAANIENSQVPPARSLSKTGRCKKRRWATPAPTASCG
jgi:hypothetical protein